MPARDTVLPGSGGELIEGVVDLAFRDRRGWTVVDFKTDTEIAGKKARYETQVACSERNQVPAVQDHLTTPGQLTWSPNRDAVSASRGDPS